MDILLNKDLCELSYEELKALKISDYMKLEHYQEHTGEYKSNYMYVLPDHPDTESGKYYPIVVFANKHSQPVKDLSTPFDSQVKCSLYCDAMNRKLGHNKMSMFMLLESIRLEELLRKKLTATGELKIISNFTIRETTGLKYILYDKGNGIKTGSSIISALNQGLAAIKRERSLTIKDEVKSMVKAISKKSLT